MRLPGRVTNNLYHDMLSQHGAGAWSHPVYRRPGGYKGANIFLKTVKNIGKNLMGSVKKDLVRMGLDVGTKVFFKKQPLGKALKGALKNRSKRIIDKSAQAVQAGLQTALTGRAAPAPPPPSRQKKTKKSKKKSAGQLATAAARRRQKGAGYYKNKKIAVATSNNQKKLRRNNPKTTQFINLT